MIKNMEDLIKELLKDKEESNNRTTNDDDIKELHIKLDMLAFGGKLIKEILQSLKQEIDNLNDRIDKLERS